MSNSETTTITYTHTIYLTHMQDKHEPNGCPILAQDLRWEIILVVLNQINYNSPTQSTAHLDNGRVSRLYLYLSAINTQRQHTVRIA